MESFKEYVARPESITVPTDENLKTIVDRYPWFTTARMVLFSTQSTMDPRLTLHMQTCKVPTIFLKNISIDDFWKRSTIEIIDSFLSKGEYKIVPSEETPEYDPDMQPNQDQEEFLTEELAEIYLAQGLKEEAKECYKKLSLLYPKKSVYFAEIIERIS